MDAGKEKLAAGLHDIRTRSLLEHDYVSHVRLLRPPVRSCHLQRPLKHAACGSISSDAACGAVVNARVRRRRWPRAVSPWGAERACALLLWPSASRRKLRPKARP